MNELPDDLVGYREKIEVVDDEILALLARRLELALAAAKVKRASGMPLLDAARETEVIRRAAEGGRGLGLPGSATTEIFERIVALCAEEQQRRC